MKKNVTVTELVEWIDKQPDDKLLKFKQFYPKDWIDQYKDLKDFCGCVMYQYGQEVLGFEPTVASGQYDWYESYSGENKAYLLDAYGDRISIWRALGITAVDALKLENYKELKEYLAR